LKSLKNYDPSDKCSQPDAMRRGIKREERRRWFLNRRRVVIIGKSNLKTAR
jgi:hypothetical protein|tara:strand:+ start:117 stop:269 length:153 start_codon:yes stop_codon:yes gene_type:complete